MHSLKSLLSEYGLVVVSVISALLGVFVFFGGGSSLVNAFEYSIPSLSGVDSTIYPDIPDPESLEEVGLGVLETGGVRFSSNLTHSVIDYSDKPFTKNDAKDLIRNRVNSRDEDIYVIWTSDTGSEVSQNLKDIDSNNLKIMFYGIKAENTEDASKGEFEGLSAIDEIPRDISSKYVIIYRFESPNGLVGEKTIILLVDPRIE